MRKLLAFLLMISLCLSLTACGGTEAGTVSEAPEAPKASSSVTAETLAAISGTKLKCARHFVGRIGHGIISAILTFLLFTLLRI